VPRDTPRATGCPIFVFFEAHVAHFLAAFRLAAICRKLFTTSLIDPRGNLFPLLPRLCCPPWRLGAKDFATPILPVNVVKVRTGSTSTFAFCMRTVLFKTLITPICAAHLLATILAQLGAFFGNPR